MNRQLVLRQNFLAMNVRHRRFGRGNQIKFAEFFGLVAFGDAVILVLEFRKLPDADQALRADHERRRNFRVAVLVRVQVEQKLNQRPLQLRAPVGVKKKPLPESFAARAKSTSFK